MEAVKQQPLAKLKTPKAFFGFQISFVQFFLIILKKKNKFLKSFFKRRKFIDLNLIFATETPEKSTIKVNNFQVCL